MIKNPALLQSWLWSERTHYVWPLGATAICGRKIPMGVVWGAEPNDTLVKICLTCLNTADQLFKRYRLRKGTLR